MIMARPGTKSATARVLQFCDITIGDHNQVLEDWARKVVNSSPQPRHEIVVEREIQDMAEKERVGLTFNRSVTDSMADRWRALESLNARFLQDVVNMDEQITDEMTKSQKQIESFVANRTQVIVLKSRYEQMAGLAMHICFYKTVLEAKMKSLESSFQFLQKCAEMIGFNQPAQILDRYGALSAIFDEIFGEFEMRATILNDLQEQYNNMVDQTIKQNMIKHNKMAEMYYHLKQLKSEITELERFIQSKFDLSSTSTITLFKIKNTIFQVYARVMEYRGWEPQECDTDAQLAEIQTRMKITEGVVNMVHDAIMHDSGAAKKRAGSIKKQQKSTRGSDKSAKSSQLADDPDGYPGDASKRDSGADMRRRSSNDISTIDYMFRDLATEIFGAEARESYFFTGSSAKTESTMSPSKPSIHVSRHELTEASDMPPQQQLGQAEPPRPAEKNHKKFASQQELSLRAELNKFDWSTQSGDVGSTSNQSGGHEDGFRRGGGLRKISRARISAGAESGRSGPSSVAGNGQDDHMSRKSISLSPNLESIPSGREPGQEESSETVNENANKKLHDSTENSSYLRSDVEGRSTSGHSPSLYELRRLRRANSFELRYDTNQDGGTGTDRMVRNSFNRHRSEYMSRRHKRNGFSSLDTITETAAESFFYDDPNNQGFHGRAGIGDAIISGQKQGQDDVGKNSERLSSHGSYDKHRHAHEGWDRGMYQQRPPQPTEIEVVDNTDAYTTTATLEEVDSINNSVSSDGRKAKDWLRQQQQQASARDAPAPAATTGPSEAALMAGLRFYIDTMSRVFSPELHRSSSSTRRLGVSPPGKSPFSNNRLKLLKEQFQDIDRHNADSKNSSSQTTVKSNPKPYLNDDASKFSAFNTAALDMERQASRMTHIINKQHETTRKRINMQLKTSQKSKNLQGFAQKSKDAETRQMYNKTKEDAKTRSSGKRVSLPKIPHSTVKTSGSFSNKGHLSTDNSQKAKAFSSYGTSSQKTAKFSLYNTQSKSITGDAMIKLSQVSDKHARRPSRVAIPHYWARKPTSAESRRVISDMCASRRHLRNNCLSILAGIDLRSNKTVVGEEDN